MRKKYYIVAAACLATGLAGFVGVYATEKLSQRQNDTQIAAETPLETEKAEETAPASYEVQPKTVIDDERTAEETAEEKDVAKEEDIEASEPVSATAEALSFDKSAALWPIEGEILLDYSMETSIYFPTLEQYRCNPAMVISASVNDQVLSAARGTITEISENEETGCTVMQDLGDGYTAVYGQLKELNFSEGDTVEAGQVIGYVSEPTKYYSVEGSNIYFSLKRDGEPVDPKEYLPEMPMDTLE